MSADYTQILLYNQYNDPAISHSLYLIGCYSAIISRMPEYTFLERFSSDDDKVMSPLVGSLVDSHCHFDFEVFDAERTALWELCRHRKIHRLLIPGTHPEQWSKADAISQRHPGIEMAVGIHPWWVQQVFDIISKDKLSKSSLHTGDLPKDRAFEATGLPADQLALLQEYLKKPQCIAIGECGLDKQIEASMTLQTAFFEQQVQLATELKLPIIIHVRNTHNETIKILSHYRPAAGGVIHGFTGSLELAKQYWALGFYLGVGGSITYSRANKTRNTIASMPLESLLLETDAPDMPLCGYQGEPNNPLHLINVVYALAKLRSEHIEKITQTTTENYVRLFRLTL